MRWALPAAAALACTPVVPEELEGVTVTSARVEGLGGGGLQVIVGGWGGSGELHATTAAGDEIVVPVDVSAGATGAMFEMALLPGGAVELDLPRHPVSGEDLFGTYRGVREAAVALVGAVGLHLQNDAGVRIDETQLALGLALSVSWSWLSMSLHEEPGFGTGSTGDTGLPESAPGGDTSGPPDDTSGPAHSTETGGR